MFVRLMSSTIEPWRKYALLAEGDEGDGGGGALKDAGEEGKNNGDVEADAVSEAQKPPGAPVADTSAAWSAGLTSDAAKDFAKTSPDLEHLVGRAVTMREQLSNAIVQPGKDAGEAEVAAYRKKIGVPETAEGYDIKMPEDREPNEIEAAFNTKIAEVSHAANISTAQLALLNEAFNDHNLALEQMMVDQDTKNAGDASEALHAKWGKDYDDNVELASRAMKHHMSPEGHENWRHQENKIGTLVADLPDVLEAWASVGAAMKAGGLESIMSDGERSQAADQIADLRAKQSEATSKGDSKAANRYYAEEQALLAKTTQNQPVVGAGGRAA